MTEKTIEERLGILETFIATQQAVKDVDIEPIREKIEEIEAQQHGFYAGRDRLLRDFRKVTQHVDTIKHEVDITAERMAIIEEQKLIDQETLPKIIDNIIDYVNGFHENYYGGGEFYWGVFRYDRGPDNIGGEIVAKDELHNRIIRARLLKSSPFLHCVMLPLTAWPSDGDPKSMVAEAIRQAQKGNVKCYTCNFEFDPTGIDVYPKNSV